MATGGLVLEDLDDAQRAARTIPSGQMALLVKHVGQYNKHAAAKRAGFQQEDVIVAIDGLTERMSEGALIGRLLQTHPAGERVKAEVLRGDERVALELPMQ
jgi:S1-C subfamily serine protease